MRYEYLNAILDTEFIYVPAVSLRPEAKFITACVCKVSSITLHHNNSDKSSYQFEIKFADAYLTFSKLVFVQ